MNKATDPTVIVPIIERTRGGAVQVRNQYGHVLVSRRHDHVPAFAGMLQFPGGSVDKGESFVEGACRELHEETGIFTKPVSVTLLGQWEGVKLGVPYDVQVFLLDAELPLYPVNTEREKCGEWLWLPPETIMASVCLPGLKEAVKKSSDFRKWPFGVARRNYIEHALDALERYVSRTCDDVQPIEIADARMQLNHALNVGINQ